MKNLLLVLVFAVVGLLTTSAQSDVSSVSDQPGIEVIALNNAGAFGFDLKPVSCDLLNFEKEVNVADTPVCKYPVKLYKAKVNYAGFGAFLQSDDAQELPETSDSPDSEASIWPPFVQWILSNQVLLLTLALALSEVLALIPGINQNGIFQSIFSWLRKRKTQSTSK